MKNLHVDLHHGGDPNAQIREVVRDAKLSALSTVTLMVIFLSKYQIVDML